MLKLTYRAHTQQRGSYVADLIVKASEIHTISLDEHADGSVVTVGRNTFIVIEKPGHILEMLISEGLPV